MAMLLYHPSYSLQPDPSDTAEQVDRQLQRFESNFRAGYRYYNLITFEFYTGISEVDDPRAIKDIPRCIATLLGYKQFLEMGQPNVTE